MRDRCKIGGKFQMRQPTYVGCYMADDFEDFQFFAEWCNNQKGYGEKGYALDKDLLGSTKCYSPDHCVFVPPVINNVLLTNEARRGPNPVGVYFHKRAGKFVAKLTCQGGDEYLGLYETAEQAFAAYKIAKEAYVKGLAEHFRSKIDKRVYEFLVQYGVQTDNYTGA